MLVDVSFIVGGVNNDLSCRDRRSDDWYLGAITDEEPRVLNASLGFLDEGKKYYATIYRDGRNAGFAGDGQSLEVETRPVSRYDTLQLKLAPGGGQAIRISTRRGSSSPVAPKPTLKPKKPEPEFDVE